MRSAKYSHYALLTITGLFLLILAAPTILNAQGKDYRSNDSAAGWQRPVPDYSLPATFVHEWNRQLIEIIKVDGFTPGSAARNYAYANVAAYETALPKFPACRSMAGQLNGFTEAPQPEPGVEWDVRAAVVAAYQNTVPMLIYRKYMSDSLAEYHYQILRDQGVPQNVIDNSIAYGKQVATHVLAWMKKDGFVQIGARPRYTVPKFDGAWERTPPAFVDPVDAYWGLHRPFVLDSTNQFEPPAPPPFSKDPNSEMYKMNMEVYRIYQDLTMDQKVVATFWDCNPIHSFYDGHMMYNTRQVSPAGHWISITSIACEQEKLGLMESLETYIQVSTALADGFMSAFEAKYHYNLIRPVTYIRRYIDSTWMPFIETPPFPEWTSAHSTISAAAASILTHRFGEDFAYDDWTEAYLGMPVRHFPSFRKASEEVSWSRVWGGIHYLPSCMTGMDLGWKIGDYVYENVQTRK